MIDLRHENTPKGYRGKLNCKVKHNGRWISNEKWLEIVEREKDEKNTRNNN